MAVADILQTGKENATPGSKLADLMGCSIRELTAAIERERRAGAPICASQSTPMGYYLAADEHELAEYCEQVKSRAVNLFKTRQALVKILKQIEQQKSGQGCLFLPTDAAEVTPTDAKKTKKGGSTHCRCKPTGCNNPQRQRKIKKALQV